MKIGDKVRYIGLSSLFHGGTYTFYGRRINFLGNEVLMFGVGELRTYQLTLDCWPWDLEVTNENR